MCVYLLQCDRDSKLSMLRPYSDEVGVLEEDSMQRDTKIVQVTFRTLSKENLKHLVEKVVLSVDDIYCS